MLLGKKFEKKENNREEKVTKGRTRTFRKNSM
jgi:hypothetical protein